MIKDQYSSMTEPMEHEFIRYVQRMVGRAVWYQALCSCAWRSGINSRPAAWAEWNDHRHEESQLVMAGLKQALTGQEP